MSAAHPYIEPEQVIALAVACEEFILNMDYTPTQVIVDSTFNEDWLRAQSKGSGIVFEGLKHGLWSRYFWRVTPRQILPSPVMVDYIPQPITDLARLWSFDQRRVNNRVYRKDGVMWIQRHAYGEELAFGWQERRASDPPDQWQDWNIPMFGQAEWEGVL